MKNPISRWPVIRQATQGDFYGRGAAAQSHRSASLVARTEEADKVVKSVCPYCGVGCGQEVYVKNGEVTQIEGDPDSPVSRGRLCPKGSATLQLTTGSARRYQCLYRPPHAWDWETIDLDVALDMVVDRLLETRRKTWEWDKDGKRVRRTMGLAHLGGATLDNEENYLIKKLFTSLGVVQVENQARVCHSSTVAGLGTSFGRGGATTCMQDLQNSDCIVIEGSSFAEAHPVGFQWVMEAKARGATVIHVDPRFSRTSALADVHVPIRAGSDIAFLGGLINYTLTNDAWFRDYVLAYTNASAIISSDFEDTEDLGGVFSGLDDKERHYESSSWRYDASNVQDGKFRSDPTLEDPRCVLQILKRHYARYTPEMIQATCGIPEDLFGRVCRLITENSGRDRTSSFVYAVGWTQHSTGSQFIRGASILQLLLGNIGRPGGGIQALRGHASIQGSTDIPTLFNLLPGYLPMPHAHVHEGLEDYIAGKAAEKGYWGNMRSYFVSLMKAWWGESATCGNDFAFDYLPRLTGSHSTYETVMAQIDGECKGYFIMGENPAVGSANSRMQRMGLANLDWLVVRDFSLIESATWWKDGPEVESGELKTDENGTEVFFFPAASHSEKDGSFTNTNRLLQWHFAAKEPDGDARSELWFMYHLGRKVRERLAGSTDEMDRPVLDLTWDYPTHGTSAEPEAESILAEINGWGPDRSPLSSYEQLAGDGSTSCGCWIYSGVYADGVNQAARRAPSADQNWLGPDWGWAWPANRRIIYNRASADPDGKPWSERKALIWWDEGEARWVGHDVPDFKPTTAPHFRAPEGATGPDALNGDDPFIMQADGKGWLYVPTGLVDGPLPAHYEPQESPVSNPVYAQQRNPVRQVFSRPFNRLHPSGAEPGAQIYPFIVTTYRLTEHFTAGGMSRWQPYLAELQPEMFCEVSPELAQERGLEHGGWATIISARNAIEARVLVTRRIVPLQVGGRVVHQIAMPFHWGPNGLTTGDAANELTSVTLDPNVHIQEDKAHTADIRSGRRPRGAARLALVEEYRQRAGITADTGMEVRP